MANTTNPADITVALLGNPNTGKSTLFNALAGVRQRVGNYPGVTVEKRLGRVAHGGRNLVLIDLPGTYSLAPHSADELVAVDVLLGLRRDMPTADVVLCILDASNLDRNLYLVSQALELGRPVVIALNMMDVAREHGVQIDVSELALRLDVPVIPTEAHRKVGRYELQQALVAAAGSPRPTRRVTFPPPFQDEVVQLQQWLGEHRKQTVPEYLVERLLLDATGEFAQAADWSGVAGLASHLTAARRRLAEAGHAVPALETVVRYAWVDRILKGVVARPTRTAVSGSDRLDRVLTHPVGGLAIFLLVMAAVFQSIFRWSEPVNELLESATAETGALVSTWLPAGMVQSLVVNGVIAGVGAVLAFLPQIALLFLFIAVLEDCGYMARAAYLMDGLMSRVGLSGKSFIPLLSCFACAVPGILATRVIENRRDRLVTILVAPLMGCSARLPVYTLLIAAFIPNRTLLGSWLGLQGLTLLGLYGIGICVAIGVAMLLKRTLLRGETPPFILELPDYRWPTLQVVLARVLEQCSAFIRSAGTLILAMTVLVWAAAYFPHPPDLEQRVRAPYAERITRVERALQRIDASSTARPESDDQAAAQVAQLREELAALRAEAAHRVAGAYMEQSMLGRLGRLIAPLVRPLGWDWRIGCAVVASFPAREMVIGAMGVIYNLGEGQEDDTSTLARRLKRATWPDTSQPVFTLPVALSLLVFYALCCQCAATLITIIRETGKLRWALFTFVYMTSLAYLGALLAYQIGTCLT